MLLGLLPPLIAFWIAVAMILALDPVAERLGLLDRPSGRKIHDRAVPVTGGLAMTAGFMVPALLLDTSVGVEWSLIIGLSGLVVLGAIDDVLDINAWSKLAGQFAAALAMVLSTKHLTAPGELLGLGYLGTAPFNVAAGAFFIVGLANAFNMIDGLDGLAGGAAAAALTWLATIAALTGMSGVLMQSLLLLAAVLGFLAFNARHPWRASAAVFMGDAGSLLLGAAIASFTLELAASPVATPPGPALLWLVALPGFDMALLIVRRLAAGQSPFRADGQHVHHILLQAGLSPSSATLTLVVASGLLGGVGVAGWHAGLPDTALLALLLVPFTAHVYFVLHGWRIVRHLHNLPVAEGLAPPGAHFP